MKITGYSESGVVNSLFYEMRFTEEGSDLLDEFLSQIEFPNYHQDFVITGASIYIEPSFSDFGQADALFLVDNLHKKQSLFLESEVKSTSRKVWKIQDEYKKFIDSIMKYNYTSVRGTVHYSNLFTQLYYKQRMAKAMKGGGMPAVKSGVPFPKCFGKKKRKIGSKKTVRKAADALSEYLDGSFFVLLVPDSESNLCDFFNDISFNYGLSELKEWDTANWGYLTWAKVERFCKRTKMTNTLAAFDHNRGQIY